MRLFPTPAVYLIDSCSIIRLDGKDHNPPAVPYTNTEKEAIWDGLRDFADEGRLKVIKQVKEELGRHDPEGLKALKEYPNQKLIVRRTPDVIRRYRQIVTSHPDLMKGGSRFDPADPWLILVAELYDYTIITEELLKKDRTTVKSRRQNMERIPDVCKIRKLNNSMTLRDVAKLEGWI